MLVISQTGLIKTSLILLPIGNCDICVKHPERGTASKRDASVPQRGSADDGMSSPSSAAVFGGGYASIRLQTLCSKYPCVV